MTGAEQQDPVFYNLEELESLAQRILPKGFFEYVQGGADTGTAVSDNRTAYAAYRLVPRCMVDVANVDTSCSILGQRLATPVLIAPMSQQRMAHEEGECGTARAAAAAGTCMVVSTMATTGLQEVAAAAQQAAGAKPEPWRGWFQLYVTRDRDFTGGLIRKAERAGYSAICVTVDSPRVGNREADERNKYAIRSDLKYENLEELRKVVQPHDRISASAPVQIFNANMDDTLTWAEFLPWMRTVSSLPIVVKGVLSPADARLAVDAGADAIVVSNHGGRQLDHCAATLHMLPRVRDAIGQQVPLLVDGGIRRGTDVLKALALGADAVLLGRPVMWGLALQGQAGVERVLDTLRRELELAMVLAGVRELGSITRDLVVARDDLVYRARL